MSQQINLNTRTDTLRHCSILFEIAFAVCDFQRRPEPVLFTLGLLP